MTDSVADRFLGDAVEMERLFIGSVLIDASMCFEAMQQVSGDDFVDRDLGWLYTMVSRLADVGLPVSDTKWLVAQLGQMKEFKAIGVANVAKMIAGVVNAGNAMYYAENVARYAQRRRLKEIAFKILEESNDPQEEPRAIADRASTAAMDAVGRIVNVSLCTGKEAMAAAFDRIVEIRKGGKDGLATGIRCIDQEAGTMQEGELIILAARPSIGKTTLATDVMIHNSKVGKKILFVSCEMNRVSIGNRMLSRETAIETEVLSNGFATPETIQQLRLASKSSDAANIHIWEASCPSIAQITAMARKLSVKDGLDMVCVDHIGLVKASRPGSAYEEATDIAKDLKSMATALNKPVLALCQLNRSGEGETPRLDMLRNSGAIEENADKVWFLHRDRTQAESQFIIAKYRQGQVGAVADNALIFDRSRCSFKDANHEYANDFQR